jgi:hypothetical protein
MNNYTKLQHEFIDIVYLVNVEQMKIEATDRLHPLLHGISLSSFTESIETVNDLTTLRHKIADITSQYGEKP